MQIWVEEAKKYSTGKSGMPLHSTISDINLTQESFHSQMSHL